MANFSSDRSILEYARHIWEIQPYPLDDDSRCEASQVRPTGAGEETFRPPGGDTFRSLVSAIDSASAT